MYGLVRTRLMCGREFRRSLSLQPIHPPTRTQPSTYIRTHTTHTSSTTPLTPQHIHGPNCSHDHAHQPTITTVPSTTTSTSTSDSTATATATPPSARPLPPVLKKGEMPPGDHPHLPGWYQRPLPHVLIPFSSNRGKAIFKEAMNRGGMEGFFALAEQFQTQSTPSCQPGTMRGDCIACWCGFLLSFFGLCVSFFFRPDCGPGTLAMVLNALALDPKRLWKGNWRWFSEEMLETCDIRKPQDEPLAGVEQHGLSFEEFLFLAECNGSHVRAFRSNESSLGKFRAAIATATTRTDLHVVASFSRKVLGQTGDGHYSPIAGYHPELDLALVLDVARFKYPPYWAPVPLLWKAICEIDEQTGRGRGYYLMSKGKLAAQVPTAALNATDDSSIFTPLSSACRIAVDKESWSRLAEHFCSVLPLQLQQQYAEGRFGPPAAASSPDLDIQVSAIFREILLSLPVELSSIFMMYTHDLNERMVAQYQMQERDKSSEASAESSLPSNTTNGCTTDSSCQIHSSPLSIYHTLLPKHTPHQHSHTVPSVHALQPLLSAVSETPLFRVLQQSNIDFASLEAKVTDKSHKNSFHILAGSLEGELELATLLLFACPSQIFSHLPTPLQARIHELRQLHLLPAPLQLEVRNLRSQMGILAEFCLCGAAPSVQGCDNPNVDPNDIKENEITRAGLKQVAQELHAAHQVIQQHQQQEVSLASTPASSSTTSSTSPATSTSSTRLVSSAMNHSTSQPVSHRFVAAGSRRMKRNK